MPLHLTNNLEMNVKERTIELITNQGIAEISFKGVVKASEQTKTKYKSEH